MVRRARDLQPHLATDFVIADYFAHTRMEDLGAAAGERIYASVLHRQQRVANRKFRDTRVIAHLDHGECFEMNLREALLQATDQVEVILERQGGMQPADDVEFRGAFLNAFSSPLPDFLERKGVRAWRIRRAAKGAQAAVRHAD